MKYQSDSIVLIKSRYMLKLYSAFMLTAFSAIPVFAEYYPNVEIRELQQSEQKITGKVVDVNNEPVIGGKRIGKSVITDEDGKFTLIVPRGAVLQISYIDYVTQEVKVINENKYSITLLEDSQVLKGSIQTYRHKFLLLLSIR